MSEDCAQGIVRYFDWPIHYTLAAPFLFVKADDPVVNMLSDIAGTAAVRKHSEGNICAD